MKKAKAKTSRATGRAPKELRKSLSEVLRERHGPDGSRASPILIGSDDEAGPSYIPDRTFAMAMSDRANTTQAAHRLPWTHQKTATLSTEHSTRLPPERRRWVE